MKVIGEEELQTNSLKVGAYLKGKLQELSKKHAIIGDVRGQGLMLGVDLVKDRASKAPATAETARALERMAELGVLVGKGGLGGNVFRVTPPMCFTVPDADFLVDVMDMALSQL